MDALLEKERIAKIMFVLRTLSKRTQSRLTKSLKVSFQQIQKYENGINRLPFHSILIFVEKIKCDISEFTNYFDGIVLSMNKNAIQNAKTEENANEQPRA